MRIYMIIAVYLSYCLLTNDDPKNVVKTSDERTNN